MCDSMKCVKCGVVSFIVGVMIGGVVVFSSKKVQRALAESKAKAEDKMDELKESVADKMETFADKIDETAKKLKKSK